jgi:hypothetical protein
MPPPPDRLYLVAREVLDVVVAGYIAESAPLPERRFISTGPPAWDCELLAVWVERTFSHSGDVRTETPEPTTAAVGQVLRGAQLRIQLVRCVPTVGPNRKPPPSAQQEDDASKLLLEDGQRIQNILVAANKAGELATCNDVAFVEWVSVGPDGGMAASTHGLRVSTAR